MDINKPCSIVDLTGDLWGARRNIRACLCITAGTSRGLLSVCQAKIWGCFWYFLNVFSFFMSFPAVVGCLHRCGHSRPALQVCGMTKDETMGWAAECSDDVFLETCDNSHKKDRSVESPPRERGCVDVNSSQT